MKAKITETFKTIFELFLTICSIIGILFIFKALSGIFLSLFSEITVANSIFSSFSKINLLEVFNNAFFIGVLLFFLFASMAIILVFLQLLKFITKIQMNKITIFSQKFLVASYPTLILACSLEQNTFAIVTNVISFFVIFSFVFKYDNFN